MANANAYRGVGAPSYKEVRAVLRAPYRHARAEDIEAFLERANIPAEDLEDFLGTLGNIGRAVVNVLPKVLPGAIQGATTGAALGPWGALGGAVLGGLSGALGGQPGAVSPGQPVAPPPPPPPGAPAPALPGQISGSSPAAAQLLQTIFRPEVLQALMAMVLGQAGRPNIPVGATQVPVGAFANLVRELADRAAAEYNAGAATPREDIPAYLQDFLGEARHDPATPSGRAARLFEVLQETDLERAAETPEGTLRSAARDVTVELEIEAQYYDELELAELYADGVLP